jgi:(2Fe-2S) ferredoxin
MYNQEPQKIKPRQVFICQGRSCLHDGSKQILKAFQKDAIPHVEIIPCGCLRQCGNGPMVIIEPDDIWYSRVQINEVFLIKEEHLCKNLPVINMIYRMGKH